MSRSKKVDFTKAWPSETENGRIPTAHFLDTCQVIVQVMGIMGNLFIPLRNDIEGNINKLNLKYNRNPTKYATLHDMITIDVSPSPSSEPPCAIDSLKWLKRGLHFIYLVLDAVVDGLENNVPEEKSLVEVCLWAYEVSLKNYHNWVFQQFSVACIRTVCPSREGFLKSLRQGDDDEGKAKEFFERMKLFVTALETNLLSIFNLYVTLELDTLSTLK